MKRSTRRRQAREAAHAAGVPSLRERERYQEQSSLRTFRHVERVERTRQVGHAFVSMAQGNPAQMIALVSIIVGGIVTTIGAAYKSDIERRKAERLPPGQARPDYRVDETIADRVEKAGKGMLIIGGVTELGVAAQSLQQILGRPSTERAVAYNVDAESGSFNAAESISTTSPTLPGLSSGQGLGIAAAAAALGIGADELLRLITRQSAPQGNVAPTVGLWAPDGTSVGVPASLVDSYLKQGYTLGPPAAPAAVGYDFRSRSSTPYVATPVGPPAPSTPVTITARNAQGDLVKKVTTFGELFAAAAALAAVGFFTIVSIQDAAGIDYATGVSKLVPGVATLPGLPRGQQGPL